MSLGRSCGHVEPDEPDGDERDGDEGMATVWAAGAIAGLLVLTLFGMNLAAAVSGRHHAEAAADLAALAAAAHAVDGSTVACAHAERVTDGMSAHLVSCRLSGWEVFVETLVRSPVPAVPGSAAHGRARAGPVAG